MQIDFLTVFNQLTLSVFALLAITNPFGNLPVFISMSDDLDKSTQTKLFQRVVFTAFVIVVVFALIGTIIMDKFFQVNLSELRIAGGIILIVMGIKNLLAPRELKEHKLSAPSDAIHDRIIPLAFPMLVGPGTLSTVIVLKHETGLIITIASITAAFVFMLILFAKAYLIERLLGKLSLFVLSRIMQVFIITIGVKMLAVGVTELFNLASILAG
ncbi:MAG: MarC family protein [Deferribacteraceae bacterium]|nr:MarC family protein [Deferribacteraceae bacterium]